MRRTPDQSDARFAQPAIPNMATCRSLEPGNQNSYSAPTASAIPNTRTSEWSSPGPMAEYVAPHTPPPTYEQIMASGKVPQFAPGSHIPNPTPCQNQPQFFMPATQIPNPAPYSYPTQHQPQYVMPSAPPQPNQQIPQDLVPSSQIPQQDVPNRMTHTILEEYNTEFKEDSVRNMFLRKVYALQMMQMLVVLGVVSFFVYCAPVKASLPTDPTVAISISLVIILVVSLPLLSEGVRRIAPYNTIVFILLTLGLSVIGGVVSGGLNTTTVMMLSGMIAALCLATALFATECCCSTMLCLIILPSISVTLWYTWLEQNQDEILALVLANLEALTYFIVLTYIINNAISKNKNLISQNDIVFTILTVYWYMLIGLVICALTMAVNAALSFCCLRLSNTVVPCPCEDNDDD